MMPVSKKQPPRYYWPHHLVFYPLILLFLVICFYQIFDDPSNLLIWVVISGVIMLLCLLGYILRQHYALINQDRIIRLEMRLRYFELTGKKFKIIEERLSLKQMFALRFASDEELNTLIERTLSENLSPSEIKKAIKNWQPDHMRV